LQDPSLTAFLKVRIYTVSVCGAKQDMIIKSGTSQNVPAPIETRIDRTLRSERINISNSLLIKSEVQIRCHLK